jgi:hypothetical protein
MLRDPGQKNDFFVDMQLLPGNGKRRTGQKSFLFEQKPKSGWAVLRRLMWPDGKGYHTGFA